MCSSFATYVPPLAKVRIHRSDKKNCLTAGYGPGVGNTSHYLLRIEAGRDKLNLCLSSDFMLPKSSLFLFILSICFVREEICSHG